MVKSRLYGIKPQRPIIPDEPSKTQQQYGPMCDIKKLVQSAQNGHLMPNQFTRRVEYTDHSKIDRPRDEIMTDLLEGKRIFNSLPKSIREGFTNESQFIAHLSNPKNNQYWVDRGLLRGETTMSRIRKKEIEAAESKTQDYVENIVNKKLKTEITKE